MGKDRSATIAKLALLGVCQALLVQPSLSAFEELAPLKEIKNKQFLARGGCGANCSSSIADRETPPKDTYDSAPSKDTKAKQPRQNASKGAKGQGPYARGGCGANCASAIADRDTPIKMGTKEATPYTPAKSETATPAKEDKKASEYDPNSENLGYHLMTEQELLLELNDNGLALYNSLSPDGKQLAREVASQRCARTNSCKGLNACATEKNKCAGQGGCMGQTKCGFSDKNLAVKVVAEKMKAKRESLGK